MTTTTLMGLAMVIMLRSMHWEKGIYSCANLHWKGEAITQLFNH